MNKIIKQALRLITNGEPIVVPTDTVYGLVCCYDSKSAVEKIYKLKKRSRRKPLILLGYNWQSLKKFVDLKLVGGVRALHATPLRWTGPLTLVLPVSKRVPKFLNKGFKTIGVRVPNNNFLLNLLKRCPLQVLASTSANISGETDVEPILKKVKLFIKARKGEMSNKPSRVVEITKRGIRILR